jgi:uncharacterized Zn finger protein
MIMTLHNLSIDDVKDLCSERIYERGLGYFRERRVSRSLVHGETLSGEVEGNELRNYVVRINCEDGTLIPRCTCPFDFEIFCKHSIALLVKWIYKREEFLDVDSFMTNLKKKNKEELLTVIEKWIKVHPGIVHDISEPDVRILKRKLERFFSGDIVDYYQVHELIEDLHKARESAENLFERKNITESFNLLKEIIEVCVRNYCNIDDSNGMLAKFIDESLELYAKVLQDLNVEWTVKQNIHQNNWKMLVTDEYGLSDFISKMIVDSCTAENDFSLIENLALEELEKRKTKRGEYDISEIVNILLDLYEKKKNDEKFILLCEKEYRYSYLRYIEYLESKRRIDEAIHCCNRSLDYAKGFFKTELITKLGDLEYKQGKKKESLIHFTNAFKDSPEEEELLEKIRNISMKLGTWKTVKKELTSHLERNGNVHELVKIYLKDGDLELAYGIASRNPDNLYDAEKVANELEKTMPNKAAEIYRIMGENCIKKYNRDSYRSARRYYKNMKKLYVSLGRYEEFSLYIDGIRSENNKKRALQEELSEI